MSKEISIGSWAYTIGPYAKAPVDFETVCDTLEELGFNGVELGSFKPHPNPDDLPEKSQREELMERMQERGLAFSGIAANLWGEKLINTDDQSKYICRVPAELRIRARSRHRRHSRRLRAASDDPSRSRLPDSARPRCEHMEDVLRHRRRQRPIRHLGVRAGLRLQQAQRHRPHPRRRR